MSFYEYFVDRDYNKKISRKFKTLVAIYIFGAAVIYAIFFINKDIVTLNYFTISLPLLVVPAILIFFNKPSLIKKTILPTIFFALVFFYYEIISLYIGSWWWPGQYIFNTSIFGKTFPLDDVIIWYFLSTPVLIGGYEFLPLAFRHLAALSSFFFFLFFPPPSEFPTTPPMSVPCQERSSSCHSGEPNLKASR